jgi:hypothetical protein
MDRGKLGELKRLATEASTGPWRCHEMTLALYMNHNQPIAERVAPEDGRFMVAARGAMLELIEHIEQLQSELERARAKASRNV